MDKYIPPFNVTNQMLNLVALIAEKVGQFRTNYRDLESQPKLRRSNRIRSIYSSLAIEANPLSLNEVTAVINGKLVLGSQFKMLIKPTNYSVISIRIPFKI